MDSCSFLIPYESRYHFVKFSKDKLWKTPNWFYYLKLLRLQMKSVSFLDKTGTVEGISWRPVWPTGLFTARKKNLFQWTLKCFQTDLKYVKLSFPFILDLLDFTDEVDEVFANPIGHLLLSFNSYNGGKSMDKFNRRRPCKLIKCCNVILQVILCLLLHWF